MAIVVGLLCFGCALQANGDWKRSQDEDGVIYYDRKPEVIDATAEPADKHQHKVKKPKTFTAYKPERNTRYRKAAKAQQRAEARQQKQCARYQRQLDKVEQQLLDGYREPRGNKLRSRQRELASLLFEQCH